MISLQRPGPACTKRVQMGFTLIELMVTLAVAVILAKLAAPSFQQYILNQRIRNAAYDVVSALSLARSEAITRNTSVNIVQNTGGWVNGWCVTTIAACGTADLVTHTAFSASVSISATGSPTFITYGLGGRATTPATVFTIGPATAVSGVNPRYVTICLSGVPRSTSSNPGGC